MIKFFQGEYRWLSNFAPCWVVLDGIGYPTTENAYQAAKTLVLSERKPFETLVPGAAKKLGRQVKMRDDWPVAKLHIMEDLNRQKYKLEPFRTKLLATGDQLIEEGNTWGDTFWGVCNGQGSNNLGQLIMYLRDEINRSKV